MKTAGIWSRRKHNCNENDKKTISNVFSPIVRRWRFRMKDVMCCDGFLLILPERHQHSGRAHHPPFFYPTLEILWTLRLRVDTISSLPQGNKKRPTAVPLKNTPIVLEPIPVNPVAPIVRLPQFRSSERLPILSCTDGAFTFAFDNHSKPNPTCYQLFIP